MKKIKGVIYDLDGTIIPTQRLHENAWIYAAKKFDIPITRKMLFDQRGMSDKKVSLMMLSDNKKHLLAKFRNAKVKYTENNLARIKFFPYTLKTIRHLIKDGYGVWICTSATRDFVKKVLKTFKELRQIKNNIVWRELYRKEKPSAEALKLTIKKMRLKNNQICYIGDALSDYKMSVNAKVKFIYFCPDIKDRDKRIPKSIPIISSHREIFKFLR